MFTPRNKETACGIWSPTYVCAFIIVFTIIGVGLYLSRNFNKKQVRKVLIIDALFTSITEIIKMIFLGVTYGIEEVEFVPLYFCSLFIYMSILSLSKNQTLERTALSFLFFGGIIGAFAFFMYPNACIPNYPIYHFMCIRTLIYHGLMIYTGVLIVLTNYYIPKPSDLKNYFLTIGIICILAYACNNLFGYDYMYISKPLPFNLSKMVYESNPFIYPFILMILETIVPASVSALIYFKVVLKIKNDNEVIYTK